MEILQSILPSVITGGLALIGVVVTTRSNKDKIINDIDKKNTALINEVKTEMKVNQAVTDTKIEELTREVREHNNFAKRMPVVEEGIENLKEKVNYFHKV